MTTIDLNVVRSSNEARIFSGRDAGGSARTRLEIDRFDRTNDEIIVLIPQNLIAMNLSFFLGLFGRSVRNLGAAKFRAHYHFQGKDVHLKTVEDGIQKALIERSIFD